MTGFHIVEHDAQINLTRVVEPCGVYHDLASAQAEADMLTGYCRRIGLSFRTYRPEAVEGGAS